MTPNEAKVFNYIKNFIEERGYSPSYKEITDDCKLKYADSKLNFSTTYYLVERLEEDGLLKIRRNKNGRARQRGITIPPERTVKLSPGVWRLLMRYAKRHDITIDVAGSELLREQLENE